MNFLNNPGVNFLYISIHLAAMKVEDSCRSTLVKITCRFEVNFSLHATVDINILKIRKLKSVRGGGGGSIDRHC